MDDSDRLSAAQWFIYGLHKVAPKCLWRHDERAFVRAAVRLYGESGNSITSQLLILTRNDGPYCADFRPMMDLARTRGSSPTCHRHTGRTEGSRSR
jgi:hypothetical protein